MTRRFRIAARVAAATLAIGLYAGSGGAAPKQPRIETGPDAEVTHDGLVRVQKSVVDAAWVKPTFDLTPYKKLMVVSQGIAFRKLEPVSDFQARNESQFPVQEENKERLSRELKTAFETELGSSSVTSSSPRRGPTCCCSWAPLSTWSRTFRPT